MKPLIIGDKIARVPIIQGGMGVGVSRGGLAGAVAKAGGVGIISTAQIGFDEPDFAGNHQEANRRSLRRHIKMAKARSNGGLVGVNAMVAAKDYEDHVRTAVKAGADVIISGAGLPMKLPEFVEGSNVKIAPIVSSGKAADIILRRWEKKYQKTADFVVIEGPEAGGHLGFSREQLDAAAADPSAYDEEIRSIVRLIREFGARFGKKIPVITAGGIFDAEDVRHAGELGADGVQVASRFVVTEECDAARAYKEAYIQAGPEDIRIIQSPVGMPGRALENQFLRDVADGMCGIESCYGCLAKCNPAKSPYCITEALIRAVQGDVEHGLIFCGANVGRIDRMTTVPALMEELAAGFAEQKKLA